MSRIGLLHPGEMGVSVAASAIRSGHEVYWAAEGRSDRTRLRAEKYGLTETGSLAELCATCETIVCVCPPSAAENVAYSVIEHGFRGAYVDANAISPQRALRIGEMMQSASILFIDGAIIGGPAWTPKETWLYLSGAEAEIIAGCFSNGPLETKILGNEIGKASALKMCYAAYSKGTTALLAAILATSEVLGVRQNLYERWDLDEDGFSKQITGRVGRVAAKAWRFEGEMREIASTFQAVKSGGDFHAAAAQIYHQMAGFKDRADMPTTDEIIQAILSE